MCTSQKFISFKGHSGINPQLYRISTFKDMNNKDLSSLKLAQLGYSFDIQEKAVVCDICDETFKLSELENSKDCMNELVVHHFQCKHGSGKGSRGSSDSASSSTYSHVMQVSTSNCHQLVADQGDNCIHLDSFKDTVTNQGWHNVDASKDTSKPSSSDEMVYLDELCGKSDLLARAVDRSRSLTNVKRKLPDFELLKSSKIVRLNTFLDWPKESPVNPVDLASTGFYYIGTGDKVQCVYCKGALNHWVEGDVPEVEHKKHFPDCQRYYNQEESMSSDQDPFNAAEFEPLLVGHTDQKQLLQLPSASTQLLQQPFLQQKQLPPPRAAPAEKNPPPLLLTDSEEDDDEEKDLIIEGTKAKSQKYVRMCDRIESFRGKILPIGKTPHELASAGFYHSGPEDNVRCFFCDIGLRNWRPGDDVWREHARWLGQCKYLRKYKSAEFIESCQSRLQVPPNQLYPAAGNKTAVLPANSSTVATAALSATNRQRNATSTAVAATAGPMEVESSSAAVPAAEEASSSSGNKIKRPVDMREIVSRLDTPQVQAMIGIGFSQEYIKLALQRRFETVGDDFRSNAELFDAIIEIENEQKQLQRSKNKNKRESGNAAPSRNNGSSRQTGSSATNSKTPTDISSSSSSVVASTTSASTNISASSTKSNQASTSRGNGRDRERRSPSVEYDDAHDGDTVSSATAGSSAVVRTSAAAAAGSSSISTARITSATSSAAAAATGGQEAEATNERSSVWQLIKKNKKSKKKKNGPGSNPLPPGLDVGLDSERSSSSGSRASPTSVEKSSGAISAERSSGSSPPSRSTKSNRKHDNDDNADDDVIAGTSATAEKYTAEELEKLVAEYRDRLEDFNCRICMDKERDTVIMPCGHLVSCSECAAQLKTCPMCRRTVRGVVKTFLS